MFFNLSFKKLVHYKQGREYMRGKYVLTDCVHRIYVNPLISDIITNRIDISNS